jgi:plasmid stabilization system protein ParE
MRADLLPEAEADLESAFLYYQSQRHGLGVEMLEEFRSGIEQILRHPGAWAPLDETYRRYRLHRFPYGIVYRIASSEVILVVAIMHLSRKPGFWRGR